MDVSPEMFLSTFALMQDCRRLLEPPKQVTVSEWADRHLILSKESSAESGKYYSRKTPYMVAVMNAFSDKRIRRAVVMSAAQIGKTQAILANFAHSVDVDPAPAMFVGPNEKFLTSFSRTRIAPLIRDNAKIRNRFTDSRAKDGRNSLLEKMFSGGSLFLASAESEADLSSRAVKRAWVDELDRMQASNREGDIVALVQNRLTTFFDSQLLLTSTPGLEQHSRITSEYEASTKGQWFIECPRCGHHQVLSFFRLTNDVEPEHICEKCSDPSCRGLWLASSQNTGRWIHERTHDENGRFITTLGFHLDAMVSPWVEWSLLKTEYNKAQTLIDLFRDFSQMQSFKNTRLALPWRDGSTEKADPELMHESNREEYSAELPDAVKILTMGVDCQDQRLVYTVFGWADGLECYGIERGVLYGDTSKNEPGTNNPWTQLQKVVDKAYAYADGATLKIARTFIDYGGHRADQVAAFVKGKQPRVFAIRGKGGQGVQTIAFTSFNNPSRIPVVYLGVDQVKSDLLVRFKFTEKGPGFYHFNSDPAKGFDLNYFKELTAEWLGQITKNGFSKWQFIKDPSQTNEAFDTAVYAFCGLAHLYRGRNLCEVLAGIQRPSATGTSETKSTAAFRNNANKWSEGHMHPAIAPGTRPAGQQEPDAPKKKSTPAFMNNDKRNGRGPGGGSTRISVF